MTSISIFLLKIKVEKFIGPRNFNRKSTIVDPFKKNNAVKKGCKKHIFICSFSIFSHHIEKPIPEGRMETERLGNRFSYSAVTWSRRNRRRLFSWRWRRGRLFINCWTGRRLLMFRLLLIRPRRIQQLSQLFFCHSWECTVDFALDEVDGVISPANKIDPTNAYPAVGTMQLCFCPWTLLI